MSTTPSRCRQRASVSTTRARTRARADNARPRPGEHPRQGRARCGHGRQRASTPKGGTRTRAGHAADTIDVDATGHAHCPGARPHQGQTPGGLLRIAHHPLGVRTQGPRFKKHTPHTRAESSPCVRPSVAQSPPLCATPADTDTEKGRSEGADPPTGEANQQTGQPPEEGTANRMGPARTTWEVAPAPPGEPRRLCPGPAPAPPGEPRPQRRPTAVASPRGAGRRCHP